MRQQPAAEAVDRFLHGRRQTNAQRIAFGDAGIADLAAARNVVEPRAGDAPIGVLVVAHVVVVVPGRVAAPFRVDMCLCMHAVIAPGGLVGAQREECCDWHGEGGCRTQTEQPALCEIDLGVAPHRMLLAVVGKGIEPQGACSGGYGWRTGVHENGAGICAGSSCARTTRKRWRRERDGKADHVPASRYFCIGSLLAYVRTAWRDAAIVCGSLERGQQTGTQRTPRSRSETTRSSCTSEPHSLV